jgi:hypothetical protein
VVVHVIVCVSVDVIVNVGDFFFAVSGPSLVPRGYTSSETADAPGWPECEKILRARPDGRGSDFFSRSRPQGVHVRPRQEARNSTGYVTTVTTGRQEPVVNTAEGLSSLRPFCFNEKMSLLR